MPAFAELFTEDCGAYYQIFTDKADSAYKYRHLSPFEFKNTLIKTATASVGAGKILDAGRGNPNFLSTMPRYAFSLLTHISTVLSELESDLSGIGTMPVQKGIHDKFEKLLNQSKSLPEGKFLIDAIRKMRLVSGMGKDAFIHDLVISTLG